MRDLARSRPSAAATQSSSASRPTSARWVPNWRVSGWWCWNVTYSSVGLVGDDELDDARSA